MKDLVAGKVSRAARLSGPSPDAGHNELATDVVAAEDVIDSHAAPLVVLGPGGDYRVKVELPRVDSTGIQSWFKEVAAALGYPSTGGGQ
jgi:hypothetical protein